MWITLAAQTGRIFLIDPDREALQAAGQAQLIAKSRVIENGSLRGVIGCGGGVIIADILAAIILQIPNKMLSFGRAGTRRNQWHAS